MIKERKKYPYDGFIDDIENKRYQEFESKVNQFVDYLLDNYIPVKNTYNKVIHDPVWGTMMFYPWELQVLDSPLLQRLRKINQVGLAVLTYPSAHHSRFEHSLGVVSVVTKMVNNINQENNGAGYASENKIISNEDLYKLRFAALMHDVGHCFFSHLSETIYGQLKPFVDLKNSFEIFDTAKEHEIFAYIIVNCESFKNFVKNNVDYPFNIDDSFFNDIGKMIVGAFIEPDLNSNKGHLPIKKYYLTQMINGQYDADKLDYLRRDSYTAGLALTYDIERFLCKIRIVEKREEINGETIIAKHLTIPIAGVSAVEEMAFSQLMLTSYIYQHQKVLATDALIQDVVEGLTKNDKLIHPCDFLYYCDDDIYQIYSDPVDKDFKIPISSKTINSMSSKNLADIVKRIKIRDLPKRALTINFNTVLEVPSKDKTKYKVADIANTLKGIAELRQEICTEAQQISNRLSEKEGGNKVIDIYDIHISIPKTSVAKDLSNAFVVRSDNTFVRLSEIVRLSDWADAFSYHKWNAYVFSRDDICPIVSIASKIVFERYGIVFDSKKVFKNLKNEKDIDRILNLLYNKYKYLKR